MFFIHHVAKSVRNAFCSRNIFRIKCSVQLTNINLCFKRIRQRWQLSFVFARDKVSVISSDAVELPDQV